MKLAISILSYQLINLVFLRNDNYLPVVNSEWNDVIPLILNGHKIERKVCGDFSFEDATKFYQLRSSIEKLDVLLKNKLFGDFHFENGCGIFLRQFDNPNRWRRSNLIFIDTSNYTLHKVKKVFSTESRWSIEKMNEIFPY